MWAIPLVAKSDKSDKAQADTTFKVPELDILKFTPIIPDSFDTTSLHVFIYPERSKKFQYDNGLVIVPDPESIELNPGGIQYADPSVDLGMIYPLETRQKIVLEKKEKQQQQQKRFRELMRKKQEPSEDSTEKKEE
jgi:hypothetical protein